MSEPADKYTDSKGANRAAELPNPELNPLMNPILGQNLGRWAEVYFTNPPEKREQAVTTLLRELECQNPEVVATHKFGAANNTADSKARHEVVCPKCQRRNEVEHRFCGFCGSSLQADPTASDQNHQRDCSADSLPALQPIASQSTLREIQWLRDKALPGVDEAEPKTQSRRKIWIAGLAILLVGLGYRQWISVRQTPTSARPQKTAAEPARPAVSSTQAVPVTSRAGAHGATPLPSAIRASVANPAEASSAIASPDRPTAPASSSPSDAAIPTDVAANGSEELRLAQRYLKGNGATRDPAQAAEWLWKAVAKHNTSAILLLADLYMRGDGIAKSCDQARLLLLAAAEKNATAADEKLRGLAANGCQ